jgi:hypothetical protein
MHKYTRKCTHTHKYTPAVSPSAATVPFITSCEPTAKRTRPPPLPPGLGPTLHGEQSHVLSPPSHLGYMYPSCASSPRQQKSRNELPCHPGRQLNQKTMCMRTWWYEKACICNQDAPVYAFAHARTMCRQIHTWSTCARVRRYGGADKQRPPLPYIYTVTAWPAEAASPPNNTALTHEFKDACVHISAPAEISCAKQHAF